MLRATGLARRFGDRVAVEDVSFELHRGEIFALLGPNGAGKTTTLRMLAGLITPTAGEVYLDGAAVSRGGGAKLRARIGLLTESPGLWDRLTVRQNLMTYALLHDLPEPRRSVDATLELFDIRERGGDQAALLSKGLKQRVALARTLLHRPEIVLLDEPTSGLDPESARDVRELILRLREERRAVLLSTHNLDEVERVAQRVAVLRTRLVALDTPAALRARLFGARLRVTLSTAADAFGAVLEAAGHADIRVSGRVLSIGTQVPEREAPAIVTRLVAAGAGIETVMPEQPPLEEVYLRLLEEGPAS